jgi:hypothetical protein
MQLAAKGDDYAEQVGIAEHKLNETRHVQETIMQAAQSGSISLRAPDTV